MGLKDLLNAGQMVMGSKFDGKVKPLGEMSVATQQREGYADQNGCWTDRGFDRATTKDYQGLEKSRIARSKAGK